MSTDTYFASVHDVSSAMCMQAFVGLCSLFINVYGMTQKSQMPDVYNNFIRQEGVPIILRCDNAVEQVGAQSERH